MHTRLMNLAIGLLLALAIVELAVALVRRKKVHSLRDTASSIAMGIGQQTVNVYLASGFLGLYALVHGRFGVFTMDRGTWWHWVLLVLGCDLAFYTGHRTAHSVNLFVAGHVVHHQAEDFNLLSSLRQGWAAWVQMFPFYLPLAIAGFPLEMLVQGQVAIMCAQFLSHYGASRVDLGVLDRIFVTPRNHRVHHGFGPRYGGANCGGLLVVWDRLFGSYVEEDEADPVVIGNGLTLNFHDPIEAHVDYYRRIWFVARRRQGFGKVSIWFSSPAVLYRELRRLGYESPSALNRSAASRADARLVVVWVTVCIALFALHRAMYDHHGAIVRVATGASMLAALVVLGRLLSGWRPFAAARAQTAGRAEIEAA